jgi:hypothetical protein
MEKEDSELKNVSICRIKVNGKRKGGRRYTRLIDEEGGGQWGGGGG